MSIEYIYNCPHCGEVVIYAALHRYGGTVKCYKCGGTITYDILTSVRDSDG